MLLRKYGEMFKLKKSMVKLDVCWYLTISCVIRYALVDLPFIRHASDGDPGNYGLAHLCFL